MHLFQGKSQILFMFSSETIVNPMDMKEANNLMPWLFDFGMQYGHPLVALQRKLTHVSTLLKKTNFMRHQENGPWSNKILGSLR